jgi:hypothetical protein
MPLRVVQWTTGAVGRESLRGTLDHPDLELVGVFAYSPDKDGVDAGALLDRKPVGVAASSDADALLNLLPDCVLYTPRTPSLDEVCGILASGADVVTTSFAFHPARMAASDRDRLAAACTAGESSLHGTGLNPGNLGVVLPLAAAGMCRDIAQVRVQERADWSMYDSVDITFDQMLFGAAPELVTVDTPSLQFTSELFQQQVWLLGDALGAELDEVTTTLELAAATEDREVFGRTIATGTVAGQHWRWTGRRAGEAIVEVETLWVVDEKQPAHWPRPQHGWTITIEGTPSLQAHVVTLASFVRELPVSDHVQAASVATAMQAVNAVPAVCAAPTGFVTMADVPLGFHSCIAGS